MHWCLENHMLPPALATKTYGTLSPTSRQAQRFFVMGRAVHRRNFNPSCAGHCWVYKTDPVWGMRNNSTRAMTKLSRTSCFAATNLTHASHIKFSCPFEARKNAGPANAYRGASCSQIAHSTGHRQKHMKPLIVVF